jgi:NADH:ubiquinone oxidoreductase subunit E
MKTEKIVTVCVNYRSNPEAPSCAARGGVEIADALAAAIDARNLPVTVERFHCLGFCDRGPNLKLSPGGGFCYGVRIEDMPQLLEQIVAFAAD